MENIVKIRTQKNTGEQKNGEDKERPLCWGMGEWWKKIKLKDKIYNLLSNSK
jgi:hypothetical protein